MPDGALKGKVVAGKPSRLMLFWAMQRSVTVMWSRLRRISPFFPFSPEWKYYDAGIQSVKF